MARDKTDQMARRARDLLKQPYTRLIIPDQNGFSAEILEFPGCFSSGDSAEEAYRNLENAAISWLEAELSKKASIPAPLKHYQASGAYLWRPPRSLQARATVVAAREGVSLNQYLNAVVAEDLGSRAAYARLAGTIVPPTVRLQTEAGETIQTVEINIPSLLSSRPAPATSTPMAGESSPPTVLGVLQ